LTDIITGLDVTAHMTIIVRLLAAMIAGLAIGFERARHYQPAGLRTHMVLAVGSCLLMLVSIYIPIAFRDSFPGSDPGRLSAQVISGIGFLGAGAIFRYGFNVRGLTTAASIWTTSGIGLAFGGGFYFLGAITAVLLIIILQVFAFVENSLMERRNMRVLTVMFHSESTDAKTVIETIKKYDIDLSQLSITEFIDTRMIEVKINCRIEEDFSIRELFEKIKSLGGIKTLRID
jgi:putative Mg2+ transporter-C (MgtC) family protein